MPAPQGAAELLRFLLSQIELHMQAVADIEKELAQLVAEHPDGIIFQSLPVHAPLSVATLLAAFGDDHEQAPAWQDLAAYWGVAPVTVQAGKSQRVKRRRAFRHMRQRHVATKPGRESHQPRGGPGVRVNARRTDPRLLATMAANSLAGLHTPSACPWWTFRLPPSTIRALFEARQEHFAITSVLGGLASLGEPRGQGAP